MTLEEFVSKAIQMPFLDHGRDYSGGDCWSIPYLAYRDVRGVLLPEYTEKYEDAGFTNESRAELSKLTRAEAQGFRGDEGSLRWSEVTSQRERQEYSPFDIVLFTLGGSPVHVGMMVNKREFIHCEQKVGTVIERLDSIIWKRRIDGVFRLVSLRVEAYA
jgi:cell wall-associated NlpC family hydrolase